MRNEFWQIYVAFNSNSLNEILWINFMNMKKIIDNNLAYHCLPLLSTYLIIIYFSILENQNVFSLLVKDDLQEFLLH